MPTWLPGLLQTLAILFGGAIASVVGWATARLISHGTRLTTTENSVKSVLKAITELGQRVDRTEDAHVNLARSVASVDGKLGVLDERSSAQGKTLDSIDRRIEQLFTPSSGYHTRDGAKG